MWKCNECTTEGYCGNVPCDCPDYLLNHRKQFHTPSTKGAVPKFTHCDHGVRFDDSCVGCGQSGKVAGVQK